MAEQLAAVLTLHVVGKAGNNTRNGLFDALLAGADHRNLVRRGPADIQVGPEGRNLSGRCSVPLQSITLDADPTQSEYFRQWATSRKSDPARCVVSAQLDAIAVSLPQATGGVFAAPPEASARPGASSENAPCIRRPSTRSPNNEERKCRT